MKKIISILICMTLLLSLPVHFASASNTEDKAFETALSILNTIGILTEYDENTLDLEKKVSRAEFTDSLIKVLQVEEVDSEKMYYHDVSKTHFAYQSITVATELGYMNGTGNGMFNPDAVMQNKHAIRVLINVLGYGDMLAYSSSPETECLNIASSIGLSKNISIANELTFRDMVILLKNLIIVPTMEIVGFEGKLVQLKEDSTETLLYELYNMNYVEKERVIGANGVSIYGEAQRDGFVNIGNNQYIQTIRDLESYLGSYVNYIYEGDIEEEDCELVWIEKNKSNDEYNIEIIENGAFDPSTYELKYYNEKGKLKEIELSRNVAVIYNGGFVENVEEILQLSQYKARVVKNIKGDNDVVIISDHTNIVVGAINVEEKFVIDKVSGDVISLDEEDYTNCLLLDLNGNEYPVEELAANHVLSVYRAIGGNYIRLVVNDAKVTGTVTGTGTDEFGNKYVMLDSKEYKPHKNANIDRCVLGETVSLLLDIDGKIAYVQSVNSSGYLMYIVDVKSDYGSDDERLKIEAFTQDGTFVTYKTAKKVNINKFLYKNGFDEIRVNNAKSELIGKLALSIFNEAGEIKELETPQKDGAIELSSSLSSKYYRAVSSKLGKKSIIDGGTIIFSVPRNVVDAEESLFAIKTKSQLGDWKTFNAECYQYRGNEDGIEDVVVIKDYEWYGIGETTSFFVVNKITKVLNKYDEPVTMLTGYEGLSEKEYYCKTGYIPSEVNIGDAVRLGMNSEGEVVYVEDIYNIDSEGGESTDSLAANKRIVVGYVNDVVGDIIKLGYEDSNSVDEVFQIGTTPVVVVNTKEKTQLIKPGSAADIRTNKIANPSKVIVHTYQMGQQLIIVYN